MEYKVQQSESRWITIGKIIFAAVLPNIGGMLGAIFSRKDISEWYLTLNRPTWTPPNWLFAPMWVILYTLMGIASYLVYRAAGGFKGTARWAFLIYVINLFLNWIWTPIFFNGHDILGGFVVILLVLITAVLVAVTFGFETWIAGLMIIPYIVWLVIASTLNGWIYYNN